MTHRVEWGVLLVTLAGELRQIADNVEVAANRDNAIGGILARLDDVVDSLSGVPSPLDGQPTLDRMDTRILALAAGIKASSGEEDEDAFSIESSAAYVRETWRGSQAPNSLVEDLDTMIASLQAIRDTAAKYEQR